MMPQLPCRAPDRAAPAARAMLVALALVLALVPQVAAQKPRTHRVPTARVARTPDSGARTRWIGIWEPVSYTEDLDLDDAAFVNRDTGWVAGASGTILKTTDGGAHWTAQVGGDPQGKDLRIDGLRVLDATHAWATARFPQTDSKLYRTTDGEHWEIVGAIPHEYSQTYTDYAFTSTSSGFALVSNHILATSDGGKTWTRAFTCQAKVQVNGLTRNVDCYLKSLQFPSARVGYALGGSRDAPNSVFLVRTPDGGASWTMQVVDDLSIEDQFSGPVATMRFPDEKHGVIVAPAGRVYQTSDGGASWHGAPASVTSYELAFADPEVGWTMDDHGRMSYTSDGGSRWLTTSVHFPAYVRGFAFPRRDRAYVVGEHGMVFRYRVIRVEGAPAKGLRSPAMPQP